MSNCFLPSVLLSFSFYSLCNAQAVREVVVPPITGQSIEAHPTTAATSVRDVVIYKDVPFAGDTLEITQNTPQLPSLDRQASSIKITNDPNKWTIFWETKNYDSGDDQLWVQGSRTFRDLTQVSRPHGNNQWNDRISAVSFADTLPDTNDENRTICPAGNACVNQPNFSQQVTGSNLGSSAAHVRGGWFVRVCPHYMTSSAIVFEAGAAHDDTTHRPWFTWHSNSNDAVEFDLPIDLLYARDIWLKGTSQPWGAESRFCVGYANHFTKQYSFGHDEDHQPDQNDHSACEC
jgi:hypothetical protein